MSDICGSAQSGWMPGWIIHQGSTVGGGTRHSALPLLVSGPVTCCKQYISTTYNLLCAEWCTLLALVMKCSYNKYCSIDNGSCDYVYMKSVACSDETTENYHLTLQFLSALGIILSSFSSLFCFSGPQLYYFGSLLQLSSVQLLSQIYLLVESKTELKGEQLLDFNSLGG